MAQQTPSPLQQADAPKANAEAQNSASAAGGKVIVGCRLPNGYVLATYIMVEGDEPVLGGGRREVKIARKTNHSFNLNGNRSRLGETPDWMISNGAGLTRGVPQEVWEQWLADHRDEPIVKNGIIFAYAKEEDVRARAKDEKKRPTGLEPLTPDNDPRNPKPLSADRVVVGKITSQAA